LFDAIVCCVDIVHVSSELPAGGDQEDPVFDEDFTQFVEEGKWLSSSAFSVEPMSLHVKNKVYFFSCNALTRWAST
jgi:hypothetical protein